jgi:signal peptidase I
MSNKTTGKTTGKENLLHLGDDLLGTGLALRINASGYSMYPAVRPGDIIEIAPLGKRDYLKPGEIVAIRREADFVVHRFIKSIEEPGGKVLVITRGDSNANFDRPVDSEFVAGRVVTIIRGRTTIRNPLSRTNIPYRRNRILAALRRLWR